MQLRLARAALWSALTLGLLAAHEAPLYAKPKPASGSAVAKKKTVALGAIEGKKSSEVRSWIAGALGNDFDVTDAEGFQVKGDDASYKKMASDLGVEAVIVGKLEKNKLTVVLHDGGNGRVLGTFEIKSTGPKLKAAISKKLPGRVAKALGVLSEDEAGENDAQAEDTSADDSASDDSADDKKSGEEASSSDDSSSTEDKSASEESPAHSSSDVNQAKLEAPLLLEAGVRITQREFKFHDTLAQLHKPTPPGGRLLDYHGGSDASLVVRAEIYPGALFGLHGFGANFGIIGGLDLGFPSDVTFKSATGAPLPLKSKARDFYGGLRGRIPLSNTMEFGLSTVLGQQKYLLTGDEASPVIPDVDYTYLRVALDFEARLGRFFVGPHLAVRLVTDTGELQRADLWFKNVGAQGADAGLALGWTLLPWVDVLVQGDYAQYGFDFNPIPKNSVKVAGGATDSYKSVWGGLRLRLPGKAE